MFERYCKIPRQHVKVSFQLIDTKRAVFVILVSNGISINVNEKLYIFRHRKKGFIELRGSICRLIGIEFALRLRTRKYRGELSFNHQHNELNIYVDPNSDVRQDITQR